MQTDFVALYRGTTVAEARLVAVTAEPGIVEQVIYALIGKEKPTEAPDTDGEEPLRLVRSSAKD